MTNQPEALRLANLLDLGGDATRPNHWEAAIELRRLHEVNQELLKALKEIADWTERYTSAGHPISTVARAAIDYATGESNDPTTMPRLQQPSQARFNRSI